MQPIHFVYWLQGYLELTDVGPHPTELTTTQVDCIKKHLALVLTPATQVPSINPNWSLPPDIVISPLTGTRYCGATNDTIIGYNPDMDLTITAKPL